MNHPSLWEVMINVEKNHNAPSPSDPFKYCMCPFRCTVECFAETLLCCVVSGHDDYGFKIIPDYEVEDMKLLAKIQALEIRSHTLLHQV